MAGLKNSPGCFRNTFQPENSGGFQKTSFMNLRYIYLIFIFLYIIIFYNNQLLAQSTLKVTFHDESGETYHLSASGKVVSEDSFLEIIIHPTASVISFPLDSIRKISFAGFSSTDKNPDIHDFSVFPNPADQYFIISHDHHHPLELSLFNIMGQQVLSGTFHTGDKISVADLAPGIYMARVDGFVVRLVLQ